MGGIRDQASQNFESFLPFAGQHYARGRNYDFGRHHKQAVSKLSCYIRHRILTEEEILRAVYGTHGGDGAEKFIQEVFWRIYFKGWLEHRPDVWTQFYQNAWKDTRNVFDLLGQEPKTSMPSFMYEWYEELCDSGYLHNHTRMWFASVWIFTMRWPWQLGARLFLENLTDGDPASNTLSWRWVAGLHTKGKNYIARKDNILTYTKHRVVPDIQLNESAEPLHEDIQWSPTPVKTEIVHTKLNEPVTLVLHEDDLDGDRYWHNLLRPQRTLIMCISEDDLLQRSPVVRSYQGQAIRDMTQYHHSDLIENPTLNDLLHFNGPHEDHIVMPAPPVGRVRDYVQKHSFMERLMIMNRPIEHFSWPHSKKGFFGLKKQIPTISQQLKLHDG